MHAVMRGYRNWRCDSNHHYIDNSKGNISNIIILWSLAIFTLLLRLDLATLFNDNWCLPSRRQTRVYLFRSLIPFSLIKYFIGNGYLINFTNILVSSVLLFLISVCMRRTLWPMFVCTRMRQSMFVCWAVGVQLQSPLSFHRVRTCLVSFPSLLLRVSAAATSFGLHNSLPSPKVFSRTIVLLIPNHYLE